MPEMRRTILANVQRLNHYMDLYRCAALVVGSGKNFTYLAGFAYPRTPARHVEFPDSPREVLLVWPRHGDPVLVLNHSAEALALRDSWLRRIEVYDAYHEAPYTRAAEVLRELGLDRAVVGFERTSLSAARWDMIRTLLPHMTIRDCTEMLDAVRWIKTPAEIALLKEAADILDDAYLQVFPTIRPGETERAVHSQLVQSCLQRGAQWVHGMLNSSQNAVAHEGESDFVFESGDVICTDYASYYRGYPGHQSRPVVLGPPSIEQELTYQIMRDIHRRTIDQCHVGTKASAIYHFAVGQFRAAGYRERVGMVGHGVGPWWHEQKPYLVSTSQQPLEAGMVLALEPHINYWHLQDLIVITPDGPRVLSDRFPTDEMFVIRWWDR
ncbi:MAG: aminopeptidase P family protein [Nitrospinae bacterium]|nr:aminopeptidase P family protein [Nitrospinota bacterium]